MAACRVCGYGGDGCWCMYGKVIYLLLHHRNGAITPRKLACGTHEHDCRDCVQELEYSIGEDDGWREVMNVRKEARG